MLKISLDEAYVFDMLSVFDVKIKNLSGEKLAKTLEKMSDMIEEVIKQIGKDKYNFIISSNEYEKMVDANQKVFELIDQSKFDNGLAKITDDANYDRHIAKMALQKRFFDKELTEVKNR
jgi:biotin operon repressor